MNQLITINQIVEKKLCTGCGLCTINCKNNSLKMAWDSEGFLTPKQASQCDCDGSCIKSCPFNTDKQVRNENELSKTYLSDAKKYDKNIGRYTSLHVGYSHKDRQNSSSGGLATFTLRKLIEEKIIDYVVSVSLESNNSNVYSYAIHKTIDEINNSAKTRYYPATFATILTDISKLEGRFAIVGVGCFLKAIRLQQDKDPEFKKKVVFTVGIICGGLKSKYYTDYLAEKSGVSQISYKQQEYRVKDINSTAGDYSFSCIDGNTNKINIIKMRSLGDMWGSGLFKANACDYCDDVTTELSDVSFGDAWIHPYIKDGRGTNIIICRSQIAEKLLIESNDKSEITISPITVEEVIKSQKGSFRHRQDAINYRIKRQKDYPEKRYKESNLTIDYIIVQILRNKTRTKSLEYWKKYKNAVSFDNKMKKIKTLLNIFTKLNHYRNGLTRRAMIYLNGSQHEK